MRLPELAALVDTLLDAPEERRAALIGELSGGDPARRAELEALLRECEREPALLRLPASERFAALFDDRPQPGFPEALAERYRMVRELGRGGMATVYLARDLRHGREVAVKVVWPDPGTAPGADRFLREIAIVAGLDHPHIVPLFDSGEVDGVRWYVMPYQTGLSLRERLARDGPLPPGDVVVILRDVCDALSYAHGRGVVHRDIKPDNVLLQGRHAMVADFGVARARTGDPARDSGPGLLFGTPAYLAPERISGERPDHRADIYSVGVLGYELLTGTPPFTGAEPRAILSAHLEQAPAPLSAQRPGIPAALAALVMKCLAKRPEDRWQSAGELVRVLEAPGAGARSRWTRPAIAAGIVALIVLAAAAVAASRRGARAASWPERWSRARIERLTDFPGSEVDAAISADGRSVAFLADRDSVFDAFAGTIGSGAWTNLTRGRLPQLFNEDVRNIGIAPGSGDVWLRVADIASPASVSLAPRAGGALRPFLPTAVMAAWSPDGSRVAYHETTPGDPIYVANADGSAPRRVNAGGPGTHSHHLSWSPDGRWLYFCHGVPPEQMDVWRIPSAGGAPERITFHDSQVAYPVAVDDGSLLYTATAEDGSGPWLYAMDLATRTAVRISTGVEHYTSISASRGAAGAPVRLAATVSNPDVALWSAPIGDSVADEGMVRRLELPTARSAAPRFGPDSVLYYLASLGGADAVWRRVGERAREIWRADEGAVVGAVSVSPNGGTLCFPVRRRSRTTLHCTGDTGTGAGVRMLAESLDVRGAASWSPDGAWIAVGAKVGAVVSVFKVPVDGGAPVRLVDSVASNPAWSPDGRCIVYSGAPRARSVPVKAVRPDGTPCRFPALSVDRVGDSYRFMPGGRQLLVKLGGFRRQDFWLVDLATGERRQVTRLRPGDSVRRFDVSPDGRELVFERVRENSDVVLIELPER